MKIKSLTPNEDILVCTFVANTVAYDENAEITVHFSNGYALDILRNDKRIFVEIMHEIKGEKPIRRYLSDNDRLDTDGAFVYDARAVRRFFEVVAKAESDFEVAFAYGRLTQLR